MILAAFVLHQAKMVSLPVEFVEITKVAEELSRATGKTYKIDQTLSRETIWLTTQDWSPDNVARRVATAFRAEWQQDGSVLLLKRNGKDLEKMRSEELESVRKKVDETLEKEYKPLLQHLNGDSIPYRRSLAEAYNKFPPITEQTTSLPPEQSALSDKAGKLEPELGALIEAIQQMPKQRWMTLPVLRHAYSANFKHAFAQNLNLSPNAIRYIVDQTNRDAGYLATLSKAQQEKLPQHFISWLRQERLNGAPKCWVTFERVSPTFLYVYFTTYNEAFSHIGGAGITFDLETKPDLSALNLPNEQASKLVNTSDFAQRYLKGPGYRRLEIEPVQAAYGAALAELAAQKSEMAVIIPDSIVTGDDLGVIRALRAKPARLEDLLKGMSTNLNWTTDSKGVVYARPTFQLSHEQVRSDRTAVRKLLRVAITTPAVSLEDGMAYALSAPHVSIDAYLRGMASLYGVSQYDSLNIVLGSARVQTLRVLGSMIPEQRAAILQGQPLTLGQLNSVAQHHVFDYIHHSAMGSEYLPIENGKEVYSKRLSFQSPIAFIEGIGPTLQIGSEPRIKRSLVIRPGNGSAYQIEEASSAGYVAHKQAHGEFLDPILGYPIISKATFQPISSLELVLNYRQGNALQRAFQSFHFAPGEIVKRVEDLPNEFYAEYRKTYDYYEKTLQQVVPPTNLP